MGRSGAISTPAKYSHSRMDAGPVYSGGRCYELINTGRILDISMGGLCVRYFSLKRDKEGCSEIKIFGRKNRFIHVNKVQFRIVYDQEVPEYSWGRCGVEFQNLSVKHLSMLQDFIDYFAFDETQSGNPNA
ncbi:MAG: PilZ domain-containing protein [Syntrophobacteraceae bacterium]